MEEFQSHWTDPVSAHQRTCRGAMYKPQEERDALLWVEFLSLAQCWAVVVPSALRETCTQTE